MVFISGTDRSWCLSLIVGKSPTAPTYYLLQQIFSDGMPGDKVTKRRVCVHLFFRRWGNGIHEISTSGLSLGDTGIQSPLWSLCYAAYHRCYRHTQSTNMWKEKRGRKRIRVIKRELGREKKEKDSGERADEREKDGRGGRKLVMNICCLSVPSPTGSGSPRIRCTAAAVATPTLSNTNTMALLSQTKLWRWIWKEPGSPQSQHCQVRAA